MGYIYLIKNNINNKAYIGQTIKHIEKRFKEHISEAYALNNKMEFKHDKKFSRAIRKYGTEAFTVELIEECEDTELNQKEMFYIKLYDSYKNGYNSTLGGEGTYRLELDKNTIDCIIKEYINGKSLVKLSREYEISSRTIKRLLMKYNIEIRDDLPIGKRVIMYDNMFKMEKIFESKSDAYRYINDEEHECKFADFWKLTKKSILDGRLAYGHRWQLESDLIHEDKIFRTKFDKEAYINGGKAYLPNNKKYWVVDGSLGNIISKDIKVDINICINCGRQISKRSTSGLCMSCSQVKVKAQNKPMKPSREELENLVNRGLQNKEIAEIYQRNSSTVCVWIKQYGIR